MAGRKPEMSTDMPMPAADTELFDPMAHEPLPEDADHPGRRREPTPMRALVERMLKRLKLPDQNLWQEELAQVWSQVVPQEYASFVRPGKWEHGVLYLFVCNSARLFEIQRFHLKAIESGLRKHFNPTRLKQVRLMIDPG